MAFLPGGRSGHERNQLDWPSGSECESPRPSIARMTWSANNENQHICTLCSSCARCSRHTIIDLSCRRCSCSICLEREGQAPTRLQTLSVAHFYCTGRLCFDRGMLSRVMVPRQLVTMSRGTQKRSGCKI